MKTESENLNELTFQVRRAASAGLELTMQAAGLILVDDLTESSLVDFLAAGYESVVIETSAKNFQALVSTGPDWSNKQIRSAQRTLASQFGGDGNATAAQQLHRLPGSLNLKNNDVFVTRLHQVQAGQRMLPPAADAVEQARGERVRVQLHRSWTGGDNTPSGHDFGLACELLCKGANPAAVTAEIVRRASARARHGDHHQYARRTVKSASERLNRQLKSQI